MPMVKKNNWKRAMIIELRKYKTYKTSRILSTPVSEPQEMYLPCDIILYMSNFLQFRDYQKFIEAWYPNEDEDEIIRKKLWEMSTRKYCAKFLNGKNLEVEYNYDPTREPSDSILINVNSLSPIFDDIVPPGLEQFTSISNLIDFTRKHINFDGCTAYRYAACNCSRSSDSEQTTETFGELSEDACQFEHFHHFCAKHVAFWLEYELSYRIQMRESIPDFLLNS
ncbi:b2.2 [Tranosema rostrale ichnovirus]|nr:b2.2 [Tranosema rostrale ichnovirus]